MLLLVANVVPGGTEGRVFGKSEYSMREVRMQGVGVVTDQAQKKGASLVGSALRRGWAD